MLNPHCLTKSLLQRQIWLQRRNEAIFSEEGFEDVDDGTRLTMRQNENLRCTQQVNLGRIT